MAVQYAIVGSGMQGKAAAYDLAKFGDAEMITMVDVSATVAQEAATRLEKLTGQSIFKPKRLDVTDRNEVLALFQQVDAVFSGVPYAYNLELTRLAIEAGAHFCDLGGNTSVVKQQLECDSSAKAAGVSIAPDCGLAPGLGNILAADAIGKLPEIEKISIRCGGLPQNPKPPLDYHLVFNVEGLINEYFGHAALLRDGHLLEVPTFDELETLTFKEPVGEVEAFTTSGGTSTAPWTFKGKLANYDYKTVRYKGHFEKFKTFKDIGLFERDEIELNGQSIQPREFFKALLLKRLTMPGEKDLVVIRVEAESARERLTYDLMDFYDEKTGFSAMERTTAYPAAAVLCLQVKGSIKPGAVPIEASVPTDAYLEELRKRDLDLKVVRSKVSKGS